MPKANPKGRGIGVDWQGTDLMTPEPQLKSMLVKNGMPTKFWSWFSGYGKKLSNKYLEIAMSRTPRNPCCGFAIEFMDHEKAECRRLWGKTIK